MQADYQLAFEMAPVGLVLSRHRAMVDCNRHVCELFGASREVLVGQSFQVLYPSAQEYERLGAHMAPILNAGLLQRQPHHEARQRRAVLVPRHGPCAGARQPPCCRHLEL